jgi:hypothetical protein
MAAELASAALEEERGAAAARAVPAKVADTDARIERRETCGVVAIRELLWLE